MEPIRDTAGLGGLWRPTEREQRAYTYLLSLNDAENEGLVRGQFAVPFFQKSGLPDAVLGGIWQLADTDSKGHLTAQEFGVAMKLISLAQAHRPVALSNLKDEVQLPDMKGLDLSQVAGPTGASNSASDSHVRRDSTASSAGWSNLMISAGSDASAEPTVPPKDKLQYKQIFEKSQPVDGAISGAAAKALFTKTKLSSEQLASIWALADPNSEGKLRLPGFIVAMYYIRSIMSNRNFELPRSCPSSLWRSAGGDAPLRSPTSSSLANVSTPDLASSPHWDVTPDERVRYEQFFKNLDQQRVGYLSGDVPVNFFLKSKLPEAALSKIWDLADISHSGRLDIEEFSVAMHLINVHLAGDIIPDRLPATLVPPSMRRASIVSTSQINLSPPLRPSSARDRLQMIDTLKRSTTYTLPPRGPMSAGISRSSTGRSPAPLSPVIDDAEVSSLQSQLSHLEDVSRGLQTQRTTSASQLAMAGSRKHDLEMKISALQATHEAETRVNQELQERLKIEEARVSVLQEQVAEASRALAIVSAQRGQLEQDVHHVQTQQLAAQQALRQAQEDSQQLSAEIAALEQQKKHMEQALLAQRQAQQQREVGNRALAESVEVLRGEVAELSKQTAALATSESLGARQRESLSFDDIFGTNDTSAHSPGDTAFGDMFKSPPNPSAADDSSVHEDVRPDTAESFARFATASDAVSSSAHSPPSLHQQLPPSSILATMPLFGAVEATTGADAFDSFGAHADDPFEEFLQSTSSTSMLKLTSSPPATTAPVVVAEARSMDMRAATTDDVLMHADGAQTSADPRSVSSTPAPGGLVRAATDSVKASPSVDEVAAGVPKTSGSIADKQQGFGADFGSAFGMLPSSSERAIKQDMEAFETNFPDINTLDIAAEVAQSSVTKLATVPEDGVTGDLTFDSVFGPGGGSQDTTASKTEEDKQTATIDSVPVSGSKIEEDEFVPPPVVKRTNVTARPMSRVLSIFRSSNNRSSTLAGVPALPKRSNTADKREQLSREQDRKFEEMWAKGDWPEWVRKGEYVTERRMLLEMGYPKDRVVEALEVNDFNLAQATDYLLSC
ncbi:hypothetical protein GGI03_001098 [Coemansia sp. RSA 2337]|nr:hypothetical protein GGI14_002427 [Coemansia sp. S680]KAJ2038780.1 hypothetical protein H4S03_002119 [Coemansia sp. S3946]KAJ2053556.1 hypothetical protein H4S04_000599 [Coemansia sp. S16]KAJ2468257.1 hypothetical protein GGI03_001098 [Coemansia sp. RSA 2337]